MSLKYEQPTMDLVLVGEGVVTASIDQNDPDGSEIICLSLDGEDLA